DRIPVAQLVDCSLDSMIRRDIVSEDDDVCRPCVSEILNHQPSEDRISLFDFVFGLAGLVRNDASRDIAGSDCIRILWRRRINDFGPSFVERAMNTVGFRSTKLADDA